MKLNERISQYIYLRSLFLELYSESIIKRAKQRQLVIYKSYEIFQRLLDNHCNYYYYIKLTIKFMSLNLAIYIII